MQVQPCAAAGDALDALPIDTALPQCLIGRLTPVSLYTARATRKVGDRYAGIENSYVSPEQHTLASDLVCGTRHILVDS
jgi:hypothetical protein